MKSTKAATAKRSKKPALAVSRLEADWEFSPFGNEAENLRVHITEQVLHGSLDPEMAAAAVRWTDSARMHWLLGNDWFALTDLCTASRAYGVAQELGSPAAREEARALILSERGRIGAEAMRAGQSDHAKLLARKRDAKANALELWKERNDGKCPELRTIEQYALEVVRRWPVLSSIEVVRKWAGKWRRDSKAGKEPEL